MSLRAREIIRSRTKSAAGISTNAGARALCFVLAALAFLLFCPFSTIPGAGAQGPDGLPVSESNKEKARAYNIEGIKLQSQGKFNDAVQSYKKAIELNPQGGAYHNNLAVVLKDLNRWQEAETEARIALKLKPDRADYHFNLGLILNG